MNLTLKTGTLVTCFLILQHVPGHSQDYSCIDPDRISYYSEGAWADIQAVRIDSIHSSDDGIILFNFYTLQSMDDYYDGCYSPFESSWLGKKIILRTNGDNVFINREGDSVLFKTLAGPGESWICFRRESGLVVHATVDSVAERQFLGISDTVKTISFHASGQEENPVDLSVNGLKIRISKSHGLITTLNFNLFPDLQSRDPFYMDEQYPGEYQLIGLSSPTTGVNNLTWPEVHDFEVGDEFHSEYHEYTIHCYEDYSLHDRTIRRITGKSVSGDTCCYRVETTREREYSTGKDHSYTVYQYDDTECFSPDPGFDKLPREPYWYGTNTCNFLNMKYTQPVIKIKRGCLGYSSMNHDCWINMICDGCFPDYTYGKGLGIVSYGCSGGVDYFISIDFDLVYYKKGDLQWGTPLVLSSLPILHRKPSMAYPNPFSEYITVNILESERLPYTVRVFALNGRAVYTENDIEDYVHQMNLSMLPTGFYIYAIYHEGRPFARGKLVKR